MNAEITGRTGSPPRPEYADAGEGDPAPGIWSCGPRWPDAWGRSCHERTIMDLKFENFRAENVETLAGYYGKRHDRTCDSTIMDNFLWEAITTSVSVNGMEKLSSGS